MRAVDGLTGRRADWPLWPLIDRLSTRILRLLLRRLADRTTDGPLGPPVDRLSTRILRGLLDRRRLRLRLLSPLRAPRDLLGLLQLLPIVVLLPWRGRGSTTVA